MVFSRNYLPRLVQLASRIAVHSRRIVKPSLKKLGLTSAQFGLFLHLSEHEGATQKEIADLLESESNVVMLMCDVLERKKLIERKSDPNDRRLNRIFMTEKGHNIFNRARPIIDNGLSIMEGVLSKEELETVIRLLEKFYISLKESSDKLKKGSGNL
jgi:DNA-binding MarR family transcriptional regulator